jgi:cyclopropane fatty-acyl-phospholipid synthase-like methyltransferase
LKIADVFNNAKLYSAFQFAVAKKSTHQVIKDEILRPAGVSKVLDFGCGIGYHAQIFSPAEYLGIEPIEACVKLANKNFSSENIEFRLGNHASLKTLKSESFDLIIAIGVLHHINNEVLDTFAREAFRILKPGGRLTTFDPVLHSNQSKVSKWVVMQDRGSWVRTELGYLDSIKKYFSEGIETKTYTNLLRIPYDHIAIHSIKN